MAGFIIGGQKAYVRSDMRVYVEWQTDPKDILPIYNVDIDLKDSNTTIHHEEVRVTQFYYAFPLPPDVNIGQSLWVYLRLHGAIIPFTIGEELVTVKWETSQTPPSPPITPPDWGKIIMVVGAVGVAVLVVWMLTRRR